MIDEKIIKRIQATQELYRQKNIADGHKKWTTTDYMSGYVKDVGDLSKLVMAKMDLRGFEGNLDEALEHEIGDCFWSLIVLCGELNINPGDCIDRTLNDLEKRLVNEI